ncbi:linker for activation of T-cells family member 2 [Protopterus annectens]|uniref:linker for activation of T-cells family member 2 n=1 Tax=Protopterus annectens TaxID=7888 RepID=UPI001CF9B7E3|nr:linker for activation of T-cells family member 2 [Protopterus annectens]
MTQEAVLMSLAFAVFLGLALMMCMRCRFTRRRTIIRQENRLYEKSYLDESKRFQVIRSYTISKEGHELRPLPVPEETDDTEDTRNTDDTDDAPIYKNQMFQPPDDTSYITPISNLYRNCGHLLKPPNDDDDDDDTNSYENVIISKHASMLSGDSAEYENSIYIEKWTKKHIEAGSPSDEDNQDYMNVTKPHQ